MKVMLDLFCDKPQLIIRFKNFDDLCAFLVGFWETLSDE